MYPYPSPLQYMYITRIRDYLRLRDNVSPQKLLAPHSIYRYAQLRPNIRVIKKSHSRRHPGKKEANTRSIVQLQQVYPDS